MSFHLPAGLRLVSETQAQSDDHVAALEQAQASGTRMLVGLSFAFKWPGFEATADAADWAARDIAGLQPWPELGRVVMADPDGEAVWWVAYRSSPAFWLLIVAIFAIPIAIAIIYRIVRVVAPEVAGSLEALINLIPLMVLMMLFSTIPNLLKGLAPVAKELAPEVAQGALKGGIT